MKSCQTTLFFFSFKRRLSPSRHTVLTVYEHSGWVWSYVTLSYNISCLQKLAEEFAQPSITPPLHMGRDYERSKAVAHSSRTASLVIIVAPSEQREQRNRWQARSEHLLLLAYNIWLHGMLSHHRRCPHREQNSWPEQTPSKTLCQDPTLHTDQQLRGHNKRDHCDA